MLELKLMTQAEFASYSEDAIARYAEENVKAGIWTSADALTNARKAFQDLLPVGLQTQDNLLYSIKQRATWCHLLWALAIVGSPLVLLYIFGAIFGGAH
jgi:hypothetical protein